MGARTYENFDLLIEAEDAGRYRALVTNCPVGDTPASMFSVPFSPTELENLLLKLEPGRGGMRRLADPHTQASIDMGGGLFDAVFRDEVLLAWSRSKDAARQAGHGLRLRLRLTDAPSLAAMPWELLYDKSANVFYAQSDRTPVVRYLDVTNPPRPLTVHGPLRILVVISSPHGLPELDVEREWAAICDALAEKQRDRLVSVDRLPAPTLGDLQHWLRRRDVHVLHFVGHGDFDERLQDGLLMFSDSSGRAVPVSSAVLGTHVRDHDPLRLVVLNACQTARVDVADPFSGMAQGLIQQEAAAVVAMQFPISDGAAIVFSSEFYGAVADGEPLDQAMASARKALLADHGPEWATPVLFLRATDGRVFDRVDDPASDAAAPTPAPTPPPLPVPLPVPASTAPRNEDLIATRPYFTPPALRPEAEPPGTEPPDTEPPEAEPPGTEPSDTEPPDTEPPDTEPPAWPDTRIASRSRRRRRRRGGYWIAAAAAVTAAAIAAAAIAAAATVRGSHGPRQVTKITSCSTSQLQAGVSSEGQASGTRFLTVTLRNDSATLCTLSGYPGVSLVASGTQIGAPAGRTGANWHTISLAPGTSAHASFSDGSCPAGPRISDDVRIYPPNQFTAVDVPRKLPDCTLTIDPMSR